MDFSVCAYPETAEALLNRTDSSVAPGAAEFWVKRRTIARSLERTGRVLYILHESA